MSEASPPASTSRPRRSCVFCRAAVPLELMHLYAGRPSYVEILGLCDPHLVALIVNLDERAEGVGPSD